MTHRIARGLAAATGISLSYWAWRICPRNAAHVRGRLADLQPTYAGDRFSPLTDITTANVARLRPVCTFDTGEQVSFQTGPVVVNGVMYLTSDRATFAIDAATCAVKWKQR
jgi:glucose dehydrogenase